MQSRQEKYWGIKVYFESGRSYWWSDFDDKLKVVSDPVQAKVFLTEASGHRYIDKMRAIHAKLNDMKLVVEELRKLQ